MTARADVVELLGYSLWAGSQQELLARLEEAIDQRRVVHVVTLNPEMIIAARRDPEARASASQADLFVPDGVGLVWAARLLRGTRIDRYPGIDLAFDLMRLLATRRGSVYLLGGKPGVAKDAAARLTADLPGLTIAGSGHGYFPVAREPEVVANISQAKPDLLVVGMGFPKQEGFIGAHRDELEIPLMIGIGGALDVYAGRKPRAPRLLRQAGMEWAYRTVSDISRLKRMGILPRFVALVLREALRGSGAA